ncbi:cAMP-responsive element modulator isoform X8 [Meriones unguiculatus]|uniref:cAMP-responsive element modulator isoform X8 n=1 Tax=Meriones unguiculatus TaxID=10047 RepID=UPI00293EFCD2|nr:cAMP-responsive element modulator isoform X8 [Meriones unguiculatus]
MAGSGTALTERGERKQGKERARKQEEGINKRKQGRSKALIIHVIIMSKCGRKKYMRTNVRQMTMETVESQQDQSVTHSVAEHSSAHMQTGQISVPTLAQVATIAETDDSAESEVIDSHKRREILSRRPSYRKILNELSSDVPGIPKIEEEKSEEEGTPPNIATMAVPTSIYQTSTGQYIAIAQGGTIQISNPGSDGVQGLQALTMTNSGAPPPGATIVQYAAQSADGTQQFFVPGSQVVVQAATGDMPTYQIRAPTTALPQGVVMAASPGSLHSPQQLAEEATRKRELRLMKNREAARECRRKKKEYVKCLENRVAVLENQNKTLIEELKALKDLYCHKAE